MATSRPPAGRRLAFALAFVCIPTLAPAQSPAAPPARTSISLQLGATHASVLDPVASPMRYSGAGIAGALELRRQGRGSQFEVGAELEANHLTSSLSAVEGGPRELAGFGALHGRWLRQLGGGADGRRERIALLLGAQASLQLSARDHFYARPALDFGYGLALAELGPAARLRLARALGGELSLDAAAPLVGVALRPYGDLDYTLGGLTPRLAAPPRLAGFDSSLRYTLPLGSGPRLELQWLLGYLRYRDAELYRAARQRLRAGLEIPLGAGR